MGPKKIIFSEWEIEFFSALLVKILIEGGYLKNFKK